jgi:Leucine-rich repeat (LRR) protein
VKQLFSRCFLFVFAFIVNMASAGATALVSSAADPASPSKGTKNSEKSSFKLPAATTIGTLDYSFMNFKSVEEAVEAPPLPSSTAKKVEYSSLSDEDAGLKFKWGAQALRLCNNELPNLTGIVKVCRTLLVDVSVLSWLDLSCNLLTEVPDILCKFTNLNVIYLHANQFQVLSQVKVIAPLQHLRSVTFHGNPIAEKKQYRYYTLASLPTIKSLDFSGVTKKDRESSLLWM